MLNIIDKITTFEKLDIIKEQWFLKIIEEMYNDLKDKLPNLTFVLEKEMNYDDIYIRLAPYIKDDEMMEQKYEEAFNIYLEYLTSKWDTLSNDTPIDLYLGIT